MRSAQAKVRSLQAVAEQGCGGRSQGGERRMCVQTRHCKCFEQAQRSIKLLGEQASNLSEQHQYGRRTCTGSLRCLVGAHKGALTLEKTPCSAALRAGCSTAGLSLGDPQPVVCRFAL